MWESRMQKMEGMFLSDMSPLIVYKSLGKSWAWQKESAYVEINAMKTAGECEKYGSVCFKFSFTKYKNVFASPK